MKSTQQLIDDLWDFNDAQASAQRFRDAAAQQADPACALELRTQYARALGLQRRFEEAHAELDAIERDMTGLQSSGSASLPQVRVLLERGRVFNSAGDRTSALHLFHRALSLAEENCDDHLAIDAAHMIAIVHAGEQQHDDAMHWNRAALRLAELSRQPRARQWRGSLHNNIGWTLHDQNYFTEALHHFERALECRRDLGDAQNIRVAQWCVARCLRSLNRVDEALRLQQELHHQCEVLNAPDPYVCEELGECLHALGRADEARRCFETALQLLTRDAWFVENQRSRLERIRRLAQAQPDACA